MACTSMAASPNSAAYSDRLIFLRIGLNSIFISPPYIVAMFVVTFTPSMCGVDRLSEMPTKVTA